MGKTSQKQKEKRLAGRVSLALAAGMFSVVPVAHGMPTVDQIKTDGTNVGSPSAADANGYRHMNITGVDKNVIHWKDFSIAEKEHVHFDNHDYMNVVTGKATSAINGIMDGGNNVYLINPNGVIFGSTAQVNVGNLYVSTRKGDIDALETEFLEDGSTVNTVLPKLTTAPTADVVSLIDEKGYVAATSVVMEGNNIRFLNSSSVVTSVTDNGDGTFSNPVAHTDAATLVLRSNASSYIHVGDANTDAGTNYKYTAAHVDGSAATSVNYKIVRTKDDLAGMSLNDSNANYMLANNIDLASIANFTPVGNGTTSGNPFKGHFDGMFYTINNLKQSGGSSSNYLGLFGHTKDARIENVGLENARVDGQYAGGIVGYAENTTILNVWNAGWTDANHNYVEEKNNNSVSIGKAASFNTYVGGLVGFSKSSTLASSYNASYVNGSGLVGKMDQNTSSTVYDSYNVGKLGISGGKVYGICMANYNNDYVYNVYSASNYSHKNYLGTGSAEQLTGKGADNNSFVIDSSTAYRTGNPFPIASESGNPFSYLLYKDTAHWSISSDGASDTTWRIYEGYSLPLLNSFMKAKGTVSTEYTYGDTDVTSSNYNKNAVPNKVYDTESVLGESPVYTYLGANADSNLITPNNRSNVYAPTKDANGNYVAAKFALFSGGQQGYDLYGNNFKIEQSTVSFDGSGQTSKSFVKEYDGTSSGEAALKAAFSSGGGSGFFDEDATKVKFVLSGVNAAYYKQDGVTKTKNVADAKIFKISGSQNAGAITLDKADGATGADAEVFKNYRIGTISGLDGTHEDGVNGATVKITPRAVHVSLTNAVNINKTYDKTSTVTNETATAPASFLPSGNLSSDVAKRRVIVNSVKDDVQFITDGVSARYVDVSSTDATQATEAVNAGAHTVAYTGIALTGNDAGNYKLTDGAGNDLVNMTIKDGTGTTAQTVASGSTLTGTGTILRRKITADDLTSPTGGGPTKTYDGTSTGTASTTVGVDESMLVDKAGGTRTHDNTTTGLLYSDKDLVKLTTTGDVTFGYEDAQGGFHESADATTSEYATAANKARYTVALDTENSDATAVANYEIDANTQVTGNGTINKRNISAALNVPDGGIVKTYDGTATVSSPEWKYVYSAGATTDEKKALEEIVTADASGDNPKAKITVTANYIENGVADKKVAYTAADSDTVTTKDIKYTLAITGTKAANYVLTAADEDNDNNTFTGTIANAGKINPVDLGLMIANLTKRYDGQSYVNGTAPTPATVAAAISITGAAVGKTKQGDDFTVSQISGLYGNGTTDAAFVASPDVYYENGVVAKKDVKYTGFHAALGNNYKNYTVQGKTWKTSNTAYGKGMITKAKIGAEELAQKTNIVNPQPTLTKTYDGSTNYDVSGLTASDFLTVNYAGMAISDNSLNYTIANAVYTGDGAKNVGTNKNMTMTFTFQTNGLGNFELTSNGTDTVSSLDVAKTGYKGNITAKDLTLTLNQDAVTKVYDGTDTLKASGTTIGDATIKGWFGNLATDTQIVSGDTVEIELYENDAHKKAYYGNKNASTSNKNIYISQVGLTGADASNYRLNVVDVAGTKTAGDDGKINDIQGVGTINKRTITVANVGAVDRDYNGSALVTKTSGTNSAGEAYDDTIRITLNNATQEGTSDWDVLYGDGLLDGANRASTTGLIKNVGSITGMYQNSADNEGAANVRRDSNDRDNILTKSVTYTGLLNALGGANGNYSILDTATGQGKITPVKLKMDSTTVALPTVANSISRTYDATTAVTNPNNHLTISNETIQEKYNSGVLLLDGASYNNKNVGENKTVTYKFKLNPNENINNYDLFGQYATSTTTAQLSANVGQITPATIYAFGYTVDDLTNDQKAQVTKVYDRTDSAPVITGTDGRLLWVKTNLDSEGEGLAKYGTDDVSVVAAAIAYADKNAATSDTKMKYSGIALSGTDAENYTLSNTTAYGYGKITPKELMFKPYGDDDTEVKFTKTYDGYATFTDTNNEDLRQVVSDWWTSNAVGGDTFADSVGALSGKYGTWDPTDGFTENSHVYTDETKTNKTSDVSYSLALKGDAKNNYKITNGTTIADTVYFQEAMQGRGEIKPLSITMSAVEAEWETPDTKVYDGSDNVASYGSYVAYDVNGTPVTKSAADLLKIYYKPSLDNRLSDEAKANNPNVELVYDVTDAGFKAVYTDGADAGSGKAFQYSGLSYTTFDRGDYTIADGETLQTTYTSPDANKGSIAKRLLYVDADNTPLVNGDNTKIYDGGTNLVEAGTVYTASLKDLQNNPNASGLVGNDVVSVTYEANFADANANIAPDTVRDGAGWTTKEVTYTFTLADQAGKDFAKNYTLVKNGDATSATDTRGGAIRQREVYVDFKDGKSTGLDKTYDKTATALKDATMSDYVYLLDAVDDAETNTHTGVVTSENVALDFITDGQKPTANYDDANVAFDNGTVTTKKVYIQNFNLTGTGASNYVVKAVKKTGDTAGTGTLEGSGTIARRAIEIAATDAVPSKTYDTTDKVKLADGTLYEGTTLATGDSYIKLADGSTLAPGNGGTVAPDTLVDVGIEVVSAIYHDKNAGAGLGVTYKLKWDNKNYELKQYAMDSGEEVKTLTKEDYGTITPKTITVSGTPTITKTYDGTTDVTDASGLASDLFAVGTTDNDNGVYAQDMDSLLKNVSGMYASADTGATADSVNGTPQNVTISYELNKNTNNAYNYMIDGTATSVTDKTYTNGGVINRAQVTLTPTEVSYYPSQLATATYTGQAAGFVNGDNRPTVTYGRDGNTSMLVGKYTLLGYVNGKRVPVNGETFADGFENYYFTTKKNSALTILAEPVKPDVPVVPDIPTVLPDMGNKPVTRAVTESVISDTKFTPDEYSYNRMSKDSDTTHVNRVSSATLQYSEKGVNIEGEDTKSGLASLADIQGRGSVVNLNGALIQTSAPAEQPEKVAETAALPISETDTTEDATLLPLPENEENDVSSIGLEYADNTGGSQSVLEILTNASSKAENKGTSIVIDTQDEDEEDAEAEKTRRAIFADRSNIGIETLGNAVNLNQMIG